MEAKLKLQQDTHDKILKARRNYKKSPKDRITDTYIQVRLECLEKLWSQFTDNHEKIISYFEISDLELTDYLREDLYDVTEELYIDHKTELMSVLDSFLKCQSQKQPNYENNAVSGLKPTHAKLPKIVIPTFSGEYNEWITFRDLFKSLIHNNKNLDNVEKMHYLKGYLSGEAEQLLRQIPISEANYERCWSQLHARYNNKKYLSHFILKRLLSQRNMSMESANNLKDLMDTTNDCLSALSNLGIDVSTWDIIIIHILTLKLDTESRKQWEFSVTNSNSSEELPTFKQFKEFLTNRYRALEFLEPKSLGNRLPNYNLRNNVNTNVNKLRALHVTNMQCAFCLEAHKLSSCKGFAKETVDSRRNFVQQNNICFNCLGYNHSARFCQSPVNCKICRRRHHSLVHPRGTDLGESSGIKAKDGTKNNVSSGADTNNELPSSSGNSTSLVSCFSTGIVHNEVLLATALVKAESKNGEYYTVRALLDQGSQTNFVTESTVQYLGLKKNPITGKISGLGGDRNIISKSFVNIKIKSRINPSVVLTVQAYVLKSITTSLPSKKVDALEWTTLKDFDLADPEYYTPNKIDVLLGAEVYSQVIQEGVIKGPSKSSVAQSTSLGWILSGVIKVTNTNSCNLVVLHCCLEENELLKKFWELESDIVNKQQMFTEEEKRCEEIFANTTRRDEKGRYIVQLPFKNENPDCKRSESRDVAVRRFKCLETKFGKNEEFKKTYKEVIDEYLHLGHMEEVPVEDERKHDAVYLPHHAVVRNDKDTTKVRVVFDASCKGKNGTSLNDDLMIGPPLQSELRHLLKRWRSSPICVAADIEKMYRQVIVDQEHTDFQRIVWRDNIASEIKEYRLLRVTFGTASAPYLAVKALQQVALDEGHSYPLVSERIKTDFYVDDYLTNCETVEEGIEVYQQTHELLSKAGFKLKKWTSNSDKLLKKIKERQDKEATRDELNIKLDESIKILGLTWNRGDDAFRYTVQLPELEQPVTKRKILSDISRLYDPIGWVSPTIIIAKIMIQKLWLTGIGWDEEVPRSIFKEWTTYRDELKNLLNISIPRWIQTKADDVKVELHGFCDASKQAYAAVIYIRAVDSEGKVHVSLVTAKTKVAPIKQISIPRLELCGAVLLTRLILEVATVMKIERNHIHAWTDSTVVLAWINSHPSRWKVFVANRVSEILTSLDSHQWSHIVSKQNPADCASRGVPPAELATNALWLNGPELLKNQNVRYEKPKDVTTDLEVIKAHCATVQSDFWERFSSLTRLKRVIAYCRRFVNKIKRSTPTSLPSYNHLSTQELTEAEDICIRHYQDNCFKDEVKLLKQGKEVNKKSKLRTLNPFLDEKGLMRVGGRLEHSNLTLDQKHPIIIPKTSHISYLLIQDAHKNTLHGGPQLLLSYLSCKYWILGAKQLVKSYIYKCVTCVKNVGASQTPLMGQLPSSRVTPIRPFKHSGVDFAGPIQIRTAKDRGNKSYKGYICLFVCMSTRALHLEVVSDLTSEGFLQAFKRFVARRGHCQEIWSDNGTNFVGASSELKRLFVSEKSRMLTQLVETLSTNGTNWHFIPPHSPNFGGLWEAGVKSVKFHLKRIIGNSTLTYEEMSTVLTQIEACLNSRPLSRLSDDVDTINVLTPGHFLVGEPLVTAPDRNFELVNVSSLRRWQHCQRMLQEFWRRWSHEYLTKFLRRYRWSSHSSPIKVGDVVIVKEDGLPPCRWLYGRIIAEHPGVDNITRVVTIRTHNSVIKRPTSKLCILPITD